MIRIFPKQRLESGSRSALPKAEITTAKNQRTSRGRAGSRSFAPLVIALTGVSVSCNNLDRFESAPGEMYCGRVVQSEFIRAEFSSDLQLGLELDIDHLQTRPGRLTAFDGESGPCAPSALFDASPLRASVPLLADSLSTLEFGSGREYNFFAWIDSSCQGPMLALISLMQDESVELRLFKPGALAGPGDDQSGFALFPLQPMPAAECLP